jgi:hypothetical protein
VAFRRVNGCRHRDLGGVAKHLTEFGPNDRRFVMDNRADRLHPPDRQNRQRGWKSHCEKVALSGTIWQVLERSSVPFHRTLGKRRRSTNRQSARFYVDSTDPPLAVVAVPKDGW